MGIWLHGETLTSKIGIKKRERYSGIGGLKELFMRPARRVLSRLRVFFDGWLGFVELLMSMFARGARKRNSPAPPPRQVTGVAALTRIQRMDAGNNYDIPSHREFAKSSPNRPPKGTTRHAKIGTNSAREGYLPKARSLEEPLNSSIRL